MRSKKIILCGTAHPFRGGGLATFNERMARELIAQGHEVIIYTFSLQYPGFLFPGKSQYSDEPAPDDLDIHIKINSINPFNWLKVGREIRKMAPDILLMKFWIPFIGPSLGTIARRVRKNGKTKAVVVVDNMIPHERRPGDMMLIRYFAKSVDGFLAMSRAVETDIDSFNTAKPVVYSPHPVYDNFGDAEEKSAAKSALGLESDIKYLLFFGFIRDYKGLDLALRAVADARLANVKLIVAGEFYTDSKPYLDLIAELGIENRIELRTDFIPNSEVGRYFSAADIIVQPYKTATQSGVTQIAYHFDKPMLVTDVGGLPEIVPHGKVGYVVPRDPQKIADALADFFVEKREDEFIANIREEKKRFGWDHFVNEIIALADNISKK
ncbi:MAG TPA: glycosyltransferase [Bacteroidetes bacterium]|nr:glycosyltransferase [Bacteroidota bacterium]